MSLPLYDAHNHLQDERFAADFGSIIIELERLPIRRAVINGTSPRDWPAVATLAGQRPWIIPSYGLHPWYVNQSCEKWQTELASHLENPCAAIGEIGLDRWIEDFDSEKQEKAFLFQLHLARELQRPVTIHCLKAWGRLLELLEKEKLPSGFLLHSYGGPAEMVRRFVELGGYFSLSGYFAYARKSRQREVFRSIPIERLLLETDAPDMTPPFDRQPYILGGDDGKKLNHPANIRAVYEFASELYSVPLEELAIEVERNFLTFFRPVCHPEACHL